MTPATANSPPPSYPCLAQESCVIRHQLAEQLARLERSAAMDPLTGLWNRKHFDQVLETEIDRSLRHRQPVSLILFDLDAFKLINDRFGHPAGDAVLREMAQLASGLIRSSDALFRWGGEEFVVLASATGHRSASRQAENLRTAIAAHGFPAVGQLTVSLGVAEHLGEESAAEWFQRADAMLYAAKRGGRNRVRVDTRGNSDQWASTQASSALHLNWQEGYESGEPTIDREHHELFDLANELLDTFLSGEETFARIAPVFDRLMQHVAAHFADEELILERHGYAKLEAHRRLHARLLQRAQGLRGAFQAGEAHLGGVVEFVAGEVVARHLFRADREFFALFARQDDAA
ncbi:Diguanylate cyclase DgcM [Burkholderiales bacterium]|nr:MAG: diguanylate cyclase [Burkholderiales bacterium]CAG0986287.1 Diguanylate cyclase DgcM [Burkholderiales bacterium]